MYSVSLGDSVLPTFSQARAAFSSADAKVGQRDMRNLMFYLQEMSEADGIIRNLIRIRRVGVNSFGWKIIAPDKQFDQAAQEAKIRCSKIIRRILKFHTDTPMYGAIAINYKFDKIGSAFVPSFVKRCLPVEIERDENPDLIKIWEDGDKGKVSDITPETRGNWVLDSDESLKPGGILRSLLFRAIMAKDAEKEFANFISLVKGIMQAIVSDVTSAEDVEAAEAVLVDASERKYIITDEITQFKLNELVSAMGADAYDKFLNRMEKIFAKTIIGNANTTELPAYGGSRAALWVLKTISADIIYEDIIRCEDMINEQLLLSDYRANYGAEKIECPYKFQFEVPEEIDLEKRVAVVEGCQRAGIALKTDEVYSIIGFTKPDDAEDIMFGDAPPDDNPLEV